MPEHELNKTLQTLVRRYGISSVLRCLADLDVQGSPSRPKSLSSPKRTRAPGNRRKSSAVEYVGKMTLSQDKTAVMMRAAQRFEDGEFLPAMADIRDFCRIHSVDLGKSVSRTSSIPRVFKFLATMDTDSVSKVLKNGVFSGPARLAPIADAIRSRTTRSRRTSALNGDQSVSDGATGDYSKGR